VTCHSNLCCGALRCTVCKLVVNICHVIRRKLITYIPAMFEITCPLHDHSMGCPGRSKITQSLFFDTTSRTKQYQYHSVMGANIRKWAQNPQISGPSQNLIDCSPRRRTPVSKYHENLSTSFRVMSTVIRHRKRPRISEVNLQDAP